MSTASMNKALLGEPPAPGIPSAELIVKAAREAGISPFRQLREMIRLRFGEAKLGLADYYANRVYDTVHSARDKTTFVGTWSNYYLNEKLSPPHVSGMRPFIRNKVMYGAMLTQLGMATTQTQAVAARQGQFGNIPVLKDQEAIMDFLRNRAVYPIFGKPGEGSQSIGSALIVNHDKSCDTVLLGNGKRFDLPGFAREMFEDYPKGYILQTAVRQHPDMTALAGKALGSVRICTVNDGSGPKVLYAAWKMPSPKAMSDNFWQAGSMLARIDMATGVLQGCYRGTGPDREEIHTHPVSQMQIAGFQIPHWKEACALAVQGHDLFPEFGVFGWDMGIAADGPLIVECNANPSHMIYQMATGEGILNARFKPVLDAVVARQAAIDPKKLRREELARKKDARRAR